MRLIEALRYSQPTCIAFVGAGGKTTALFQAAREILATDQGSLATHTVLVTTSTHLGEWQSKLADHVRIVTSDLDVRRIGGRIPSGVVLVCEEVNNNLLGGLSPTGLDELRQIAEDRNLPLLIEADGAHTRPLKAPAAYEPAIPDFVQHVVVVAGLSGLGKPLTADWVHRVDEFANLSGLLPGEEVTGEALVSVLLNNQGGLKHIPVGARRSVLLNQADTPDLLARARQIAVALIKAYDASLIASLAGGEAEEELSPGVKTERHGGVQAVIEPIAGIILAAGGSSRFGKPKQLLTWKGAPLIRHVAITAMEAGLSPVIVVIGSFAPEIESTIQDMPVRIVNNGEWEKGLSTSIRAGIRALPVRTGGTIFLQADQPQIPPALIRSLVEAHQYTLAPIIAPQIEGRRGNPVLFDACSYTRLASLEGDVGGRALFSQLPVHWVTWQDPHVLVDIDTPDDYEFFLKIYPPGKESA